MLYQKSKKEKRGCKLQSVAHDCAAYTVEGEYNGSSGYSDGQLGRSPPKTAHANHKVPDYLCTLSSSATYNYQ